jgi:hypothetical protein
MEIETLFSICQVGEGSSSGSGSSGSGNGSGSGGSGGSGSVQCEQKPYYYEELVLLPYSSFNNIDAADFELVFDGTQEFNRKPVFFFQMIVDNIGNTDAFLRISLVSSESEEVLDEIKIPPKIRKIPLNFDGLISSLRIYARGSLKIQSLGTYGDLEQKIAQPVS